MFRRVKPLFQLVLGALFTIAVWKLGIEQLVWWRSDESRHLYYAYMSVLFGIPLPVFVVICFSRLECAGKGRFLHDAGSYAVPLIGTWGSMWALSTTSPYFPDSIKASFFCWLAGVVLGIILVVLAQHKAMHPLRRFSTGAGYGLLAILLQLMWQWSFAGVPIWHGLAICAVNIIGVIILFKFESIMSALRVLWRGIHAPFAWGSVEWKLHKLWKIRAAREQLDLEEAKIRTRLPQRSIYRAPPQAPLRILTEDEEEAVQELRATEEASDKPRHALM